MRKVISQQMSFGDGFIDASLYELDEELKKVDELLGDAKLLKPFEEVFDDSMGRPGTAVGIYLRMMYLKFRWGLSYEEVEAEVRERLPWRYFCHLSLMDSVPDATTLIKLNQRFGEERMTELNRLLIKSLVKTRSIKPRPILGWGFLPPRSPIGRQDISALTTASTVAARRAWPHGRLRRRTRPSRTGGNQVWANSHWL